MYINKTFSNASLYEKMMGSENYARKFVFSLHIFKCEKEILNSQRHHSYKKAFTVTLLFHIDAKHGLT